MTSSGSPFPTRPEHMGMGLRSICQEQVPPLCSLSRPCRQAAPDVPTPVHCMRIVHPGHCWASQPRPNAGWLSGAFWASPSWGQGRESSCQDSPAQQSYRGSGWGRVGQALGRSAPPGVRFPPLLCSRDEWTTHPQASPEVDQRHNLCPTYSHGYRVVPGILVHARPL